MHQADEVVQQPQDDVAERHHAAIMPQSWLDQSAPTLWIENSQKTASRVQPRRSMSFLENDDLAHRLALAQAIKAQVDLVESQSSGQQPIDRHTPLAIERDVARQVAHRDAGADVTALDRALLGDQVDLRNRQHVRGRRQAGGNRSPAAPRYLVRELHRLDRSRELEGKVDTAGGGRLDLVDTGVGPGIV